MNYRHIYHAGNICEIVKHLILIELIKALQAKPKGFFVLDTHAGLGLYPLKSEQAQKTREHEQGIGVFANARTAEDYPDYFNLLKGLYPDFYPGSPLIIQQMLRPQDRFVCVEKHPEDVEILKQNVMKGKVLHQDGYVALKALIPPPERRGLIFIDPPFEKGTEREQLIKSVGLIKHKWPTACVCIWYPIKDQHENWEFHQGLESLGFPKTLIADFMYKDFKDETPLKGSGFVIINPPWKFEERLAIVFKDLASVYGASHLAQNIFWLVPELV